MTTDTTQQTEAHIGHGFLTTALEGGIGYWARAYNIRREQLSGDLAMEDFREYTAVTLVEFEDAGEALDTDPNLGYAPLDAAYEAEDTRLEEFTHTITADQLRDYFLSIVRGQDQKRREVVGMRRALQWGIAYLDDERYPDLDAEDADVLVQAVALGEVRYG